MITSAVETPPTGICAANAAKFRALVPTLATERLTLRAPKVQDFPIYADIACTDRGIGIGGPMSREDAWWDFVQMASGWMLHGHGGWTVAITSTDTPIGFVMLGLEPGDQEPELGYLIAANHEGQGYMVEAAQAARHYAFHDLKMPNLVSYIFPSNARSIALATRLGALQDGALSYPGDDEPSLVFRHPNPNEA